MKNAIVNARMEIELKSEVEAIFKQLGMNTTQAITMFFEQVRLHRAIPFQIKLPNIEMVNAMEARKLFAWGIESLFSLNGV